MSALSLSQFIGQTGTLTVELSLTVPVRVLDARQCWDRLDFYVQPVHGAGHRWVQASRVTLDSDKARQARQEVVL